jgi:hypothetical protein
MAATFSDIVAYFEKIARQHVAIGHSQSEKHFYRYELEEVVTGLREINYPALILEWYRYLLKDFKGDNVMKERTGAFILLGHLNDPEDFDAMHDLWDSLEVIHDDIIARMKSDKLSEKAVRDFDLNSVEVALIANVHDQNFGLRCLFTIASPKKMEVEEAKWNYKL